MSGQSNFTDFFLEKIGNVNGVPIAYYRVPSAILSSDQEKVIGLDNVSPNSLKLMKLLGSETAIQAIAQPVVRQAFSNFKTHKF